MENNYRILGINEDSDLNEVKKAYLNKVRVFTPEENPDEFIKIRKAYERILYENSSENNIKENFLKITELTILEDKKEDVYKYTNLIKSNVNLDNFKFVSDKLVDTIIYCNNNNRGDISLTLIDEFIGKFEELKLVNLKDSYLLLRDRIEKRS